MHTQRKLRTVILNVLSITFSTVRLTHRLKKANKFEGLLASFVPKIRYPFGHGSRQGVETIVGSFSLPGALSRAFTQ
jgi:hypothetical protein